MSFADKILRYCIENRVSTTEVADALGKNGVLSGVQPINRNQYRAGFVRTVFAANKSNYAVHVQIRNVEKGDVVIIFSHNCEGRAIVGDLVSKYLLFYKGAQALVVNGLVRDAASLKRESYAVWSEGVTPLGCFNDEREGFPKELENTIRDKYDGGIAICDDGGVVVIPESYLNEEMFIRLQRIEMQEDIWFFCLDTLKWDTKKIVCDKAYLAETELLSDVHVRQLKEIGDLSDE